MMKNITIIFVDYYVAEENNGICAYRKKMLDGLRKTSTFRLITLLVRCPFVQQIETTNTEEGELLIFTPYDIVHKHAVKNTDKELAKFLKILVGNNRTILHLNWMNHYLFCAVIQRYMDAKVVLTKHCVSWRENIIRNYPLFFHMESRLKAHRKASFLAQRLLNEEISFFRGIDHIITVTHDAQNVLTQLYGIPARKVSCIHNGIERSPIQKINKSEWKKKYGFEEDDYIILFAGTLNFFKGLQELFKIMFLLHKHGYKFHLVICGSGNFQAVLSAVPPCLIPFVSLTGNLKRELLYKFMQFADIGIVPSLEEQCSYVALEMIQHSLPIITSDTDGLKEILPENEGLLIPILFHEDKYETDITEGVRLVMKLYQNPEYTNHYTKLLQKHISAYFSTERMVSKTLDVYRKLMEQRSTAIQKCVQGPLVSIVIPCYNAEKYLEECLESILQQNYLNIEIILINDGSTDRTNQIAKQYVKKERRIRLLQHYKNQGIVNSLKKGIKAARGKYIARIDADDTMLGERILKQCSFLEQNPEYAIVGCNVVITDAEGFPIRYINFPESHEEILLMRFFMNPFAHSGVMIRKEIFQELKYRKKYAHCEDYHLWMEICKRFKTYNLQEFLSTYRINSYSISARNKKEQNENAVALLLDELEKCGIETKQDEKNILAAARLGMPAAYWKKHYADYVSLFQKLTANDVNIGKELSPHLLLECIKQKKL